MEQKIKKRFEKVEGKVKKIENFIQKSLSKKGKLVRCDRCGNSWITRSDKQMVSCSSCGQKVKVNEMYVKGKSWGEVAEKSGMF